MRLFVYGLAMQALVSFSAQAESVTASKALDSNNIRYVFQSAVKPFAQARPMTFGLSTQQAEKIRGLTHDRVRFDQYYFFDAPQDMKLVMSTKSLVGRIH